MADQADNVPYLDISAPEFSVRSQAARAARDNGWHARTPYGIAVLRYDEVKSLLLHPMLRQGSYKWPDHNTAAGPWAQWWKRIMLNLEGPDHARLRRLAQPAFAPRRVAALVPEFQRIADDLVSGFEGNGECEFMSEFAEPYAAKVVCCLIGLSDSGWRELADLAVRMGLALGVTYKRDERIVDEAALELLGRAKRLVERARAVPKDDFLGALVRANADKSAFSDGELHDMVALLVFGGIDTTRNQLGLAVQVFIENPDQWALLGERPELARQAVEEVMRLRPTVTWVTREAVCDFEFQGLRIHEGTTIHLFTESAGTDPCQFTAGMDIAAKRKPHFGFGAGVHHCIGSPVARNDMSEALKLLSRRLPKLAASGPAEWLPESGNTGPARLPIRFDRPRAETPEAR